MTRISAPIAPIIHGRDAVPSPAALLYLIRAGGEPTRRARRRR